VVIVGQGELEDMAISSIEGHYQCIRARDEINAHELLVMQLE
jgi:hypothetical protein